jgi:hypothetical protein
MSVFFFWWVAADEEGYFVWLILSAAAAAGCGVHRKRHFLVLLLLLLSRPSSYISLKIRNTINVFLLSIYPADRPQRSSPLGEISFQRPSLCTVYFSSCVLVPLDASRAPFVNSAAPDGWNSAAELVPLPHPLSLAVYEVRVAFARS